MDVSEKGDLTIWLDVRPCVSGKIDKATSRLVAVQ
jgi:hypothetical protein